MDPRKRLQVLNQSNPSLRTSVAPQPAPVNPNGTLTLRAAPTVLSPNSNNARVLNPVRQVQYAPAQPKKTFINKVGGALFGNAAKLANTAAAGAKVAWGLGNITKESLFGTDQSYASRVNQVDRQITGDLDKPNGGLFGKGTFFKNREEAQNISAGDLTKKIIGGGLGTAAEVVPLTRGGQLVNQGGKLVTKETGTKLALPAFGKKLAQATGEGAVYGGAGSAGSQLVEDGKIDGKQTALNALIGGATGGGTFGAGRGLFKARGGESKAGARIVSRLAETNSVDKVSSMLKKAGVNHEVASTTAEYIAKEDSKEAIEAILKSIEIDPSINIDPALRQKLQDEGVKKVEVGETPYGAEYRKDGTIRVSDASKATPDALYHELGHHIYTNKLTPEEKAVFANIKGSASKQAEGREGYTPDDFASEDFSDFIRKANEGKINEVPEAVRPIIAKYAKVVAQQVDSAKTGTVPDTTIHIPSKGIHAKVTPEQAAFLKNEVGNVKSSADDIVHLSAPTDALKRSSKEVSIDEIKAASANAKQTLDNIPGNQAVKDAADLASPAGSPNAASAVTKAADEVSAAQTGTSYDGAIKQLEGDTTQEHVQTVLDSLKSAQKGVDEVTQVRKGEKAARASASDAAYEAAGGGEAGRRAALKALQGEYSKSGYVAPKIPQESKDAMLNEVQGSDLRTFEKRNTQNAFAKVFGDTDAKPTQSDIIYIRKFLNKKEAGLGDQVAQEIEALVEASPKNWRDKIVDIAGIPRAAMASFDLSFGGRQGLPVAVRSAKEWATANKESIKYAANKDYFDGEMRKLTEADDYDLITSKLGVRLPGAEGQSDEVMASANLLEKIPVYGKGIEASDRAYSGGLTKLRYEIAKKWVKDLGGVDKLSKDFSEKELKDIGEVINTFTGSGGKPGGITERHMQTLATTLFAPRLWAANLNRLNPAFYARLSPEARKRALQYQSSFAGLAGSVLALAAAAGATVVWDPRSADFAKIKVGNTRYDILGGQQQNIRFLAQQLTGEKINSSTGEKATIGEGIQPSRFDLAIDFAGNKLNPLLGFAKNQLQKDSEGKTKFGEDSNIFQEVANLLTPLNIQSIVETSKDRGSVPKGIAMNLPGFVGFGTQTYGDTKTKDQGSKNAQGVPTFKGKITPDMITDAQGKPVLDEKGRPVKATIPKDATELERSAIIDAKRKSALSDQYKRTLSKEDQALMKLNDEELRKYVDGGKIDQARFDQIKNFKKTSESQGKNNEYTIPEGVESKPAKDFYSKWNSMDEKDQKAWLDQTPDDSAKQVAKLLNAERAKGLSEFKPSNHIAKAYAEYEKDINSHPEYTAIDKRNKAKAFQSFAYKLNYSTNQRDLYNEGSSNDTRYLINDKQISKEDLNEAIKIDDELYNAGITTTLKFSKKFRNEFGYGLPSGGGVNKNPNSSGGSGGSGDPTPRTYVGKLLPSFKLSNNGGQAPTFSKKPRTKSSVSSVDLPSKSGKKISINL